MHKRLHRHGVRRFTFLFPLLLTACATAGAPVELTEVQRQAARDSVIAVLKDPDSARFGEIRGARQSDGTVIVCGMVNARTGFGGYAGMSPFTGYFEPGRSAFTLNEVGTSDASGAMLYGCRLRGIQI